MHSVYVETQQNKNYSPSESTTKKIHVTSPSIYKFMILQTKRKEIKQLGKFIITPQSVHSLISNFHHPQSEYLQEIDDEVHVMAKCQEEIQEGFHKALKHVTLP